MAKIMLVGITGIASYGGMVPNCVNYGNVTGNMYVGGIYGYAYDAYKLTGCVNYGNIKGEKCVGGIAGEITIYEGEQEKILSDAINHGTVEGTTNVGDLIGIIYEDDEFCFVAGTKVYTPNGYKNIEDIQIGDIVYSMNLQTMQVEEKAVERLKITENACTLFYLISTGTDYIESTPEHRFYVKDRGWLDACELKVGDILINESGNEKAITDIQTKTYDKPITVYNFEVEDNRNYFVGEDKILVYTIPNEK